MELTDKVWLAAVLDCEGTISVHRSGQWYKPTLNVTSTCIDLVRKVEQVTDAGFVTKQAFAQFKNHPEWKTPWRWEVHRLDKVAVILKEVIPWMIVKRKQAELLLEFCEKRLKHPHHPLTEEERNLADRIRQLNTRGQA
jgi:hypothetical protein